MVADNKFDLADRTAENTDSAVADCRQSAVRYQPQAVQSAHSRKGSVQRSSVEAFSTGCVSGSGVCSTGVPQ